MPLAAVLIRFCQFVVLSENLTEGVVSSKDVPCCSHIDGLCPLVNDLCRL
jgi:hypothetical protein